MSSWLIRAALERENGTVEEQQNALKTLDHELRYIRKSFPHKAERCTQILKDINYSVNIYIAKKRRLAKALCKDAMKCLKVHLEIEIGMIGSDRELVKEERELTKEREAFAEETKDRFKEVLNLEVEITKAEREITELGGEITTIEVKKTLHRGRVSKIETTVESLRVKITEFEAAEDKAIKALEVIYLKHLAAIKETNARRLAEYNKKLTPTSNGLRANKV